MSMYCIQVNKLLQPLKNGGWSKTKQNLYVTLTYDKQQRRTTCKPLINSTHIWYESFLFVLDKDEKKKMKIEIFHKNNKKNDAIVSEIIEMNRSRMVKKTTKYLEIQHGLINYDNEQKIKSLENDNKGLNDKNNQLRKDFDKLVSKNDKFRILIESIDNLINDEAYE